MIKTVDVRGNEISLNSHQKNEIYRKAKQLREEIRSGMITKTQHWDANDYNVREFMRREGHPDMAKKITEYKKSMQAIGAEVKDMDIERMRRPR